MSATIESRIDNAGIEGWIIIQPGIAKVTMKTGDIFIIESDDEDEKDIIDIIWGN